MDEKKENIINQLFTGREDLTSLPTLFGEFIILVNNPSVSPRKVAELIKKDQGMAAKIIKFSNRLPVWDKVVAISKADVDPDKLTLQLMDATPHIKLTVTSLLGEKSPETTNYESKSKY